MEMLLGRKIKRLEEDSIRKSGLETLRNESLIVKRCSLKLLF